MVQALHTGDREKIAEFSNAILRNMEDDNFLPRLIFSDEATKLTVTKPNIGTRRSTRDFRTSP